MLAGSPGITLLRWPQLCAWHPACAPLLEGAAAPGCATWCALQVDSTCSSASSRPTATRAPAQTLCYGASIQVCRFALDQYRAAGIHVHVNCSPVEVTPQVDDDSDGSAAGADGGGGAAPRRGALRVRVQRQPPAAAGGSAAEAGAAGPKEFVIAGVDEVVLAVGRGGKAAGIGLEEAGVKLGEAL